MAQSPDAAVQSMIASLEAKTGRSLEAWVKVAQKSGLEKHGQIVALLKRDHGVTHGYANLIAHSTLPSDAASVAAQGTDLVAARYEGPKAGRRPIYDALARKVQASARTWS